MKQSKIVMRPPHPYHSEDATLAVENVGEVEILRWTRPDGSVSQMRVILRAREAESDYVDALVIAIPAAEGVRVKLRARTDVGENFEDITGEVEMSNLTVLRGIP